MTVPYQAALYRPFVSDRHQKALFLDRDGVLNVDHVDYAWKPANFTILPGVPEALKAVKAKGYKIIIVTNQSGVAKGVYTKEDVLWCLEQIQQASDYAIDGHYMGVHHPDFTTRSFERKPDSLLFEKAIARFQVDVGQSIMFGDKGRDLEPAAQVGIRQLIAIDNEQEGKAIRTGFAKSMPEAVERYMLD